MARFKTSTTSQKSSSSSKTFSSSNSDGATGSFTMSFKKSESKLGGSSATGGAASNPGEGRTLKSTRININQEQIADFALVRPRILPVLKPKNWERSTKDLLKKVDPTKPTDVLFFSVKTLPGTALGYTLAIVEEDGSLHYILRSYLDAWKIPEKVIMDVALRNLEQRLENRGSKLWTRSKAGVYYIENLGPVSASVVLLPQFIEVLDAEEGDYVVVVPSGDICMVAGAKNDMRLCIMGEIALRYSKDPQRFNIKPLRFSRNRFSDYTPKTYAKEETVPQSVEEVSRLKLRLRPVKVSRQK